MATPTTTSKTLLDELRHAYEMKGDTLTCVDADEHRYGLRAKNTYIRQFGTWNKAMKRAGLPANNWKGGRTKGTPNRRGRMAPTQRPHETLPQNTDEAFTTLEATLEAKLAAARAEEEMLERMLATARELHLAAA